MFIREATIGDVPQIVELERHAPTAAHWNPAQYEAMFLPDAPRRKVKVAVEDADPSAVLGFAVVLCMGDEWEVESVVVGPSLRRRGIGAALLRAVLAEANSAGIAEFILEVRESNLPARQLYERIGFTEVSQRKNYYQGPLEHAILYRLQLRFGDKTP